MIKFTTQFVKNQLSGYFSFIQENRVTTIPVSSLILFIRTFEITPEYLYEFDQIAKENGYTIVFKEEEKNAGK